MTDPNPHDQRHGLEYAAGLPRERAASKLAVLSLILAISSCPFCLVGALHPINRIINELTWTYVAGARNSGDRMGAWVPIALFGIMGIATVLPIVAIVRSVRAKSGGSVIAAIALAIALLWWPLLYMAARGAAALGGRY